MKGSSREGIRITIDDVYDIAAEVCEEMIGKFLSNLVKLVPTGEDIVEDIKEDQWRSLRSGRMPSVPRDDPEMVAIKQQVQKSVAAQFQDDIAEIRQKPQSANDLISDDFMSQIELENDLGHVGLATDEQEAE